MRWRRRAPPVAAGGRHLGGMRCSEDAGSRAARAAAPRGGCRAAGRSPTGNVPDQPGGGQAGQGHARLTRQAGSDAQSRGLHELVRAHWIVAADGGGTVLGAEGAQVRQHVPSILSSRAGRSSGPARAAGGEWCRDTRAAGLLRGARHQWRGERLPHPGDTALARAATAPQPANPDHLGQDKPHRNPVDTPDPHRASIPAGALAVTHPR